MPISVAALMPAEWISRKLPTIPENVKKVILPGHVRGDLHCLEQLWGVEVIRGPKDLRDLPLHFGLLKQKPADYGQHELEIIAEINHAPDLPHHEILRKAQHYRSSGADRIDLGCNPGETWSGIDETVRLLIQEGFRVSVDSFNTREVESAVHAGCDLVLSVNSSNREAAKHWDAEVVVIPDTTDDLQSLFETRDYLEKHGARYRLDPILEPFGHGLMESLVRYWKVRNQCPDAAIMMGIGNVTELTDVDSAGLNVFLTGICAELRIQSVLTTEVIHWAQSSVKEIDLARRLMFHAVRNRVVPKYLEPDLITLRDARIHQLGPETLAELQATIKDPNWRIFAENGEIYALNHENYLKDSEPFRLFEQMGIDDPSHAFYLGYEMAKAKTALSLGKWYRQDQALNWGHLTEEEPSHWDGKKPTNSSDHRNQNQKK